MTLYIILLLVLLAVWTNAYIRYYNHHRRESKRTIYNRGRAVALRKSENADKYGVSLYEKGLRYD